MFSCRLLQYLYLHMLCTSASKQLSNAAAAHTMRKKGPIMHAHLWAAAAVKQLVSFRHTYQDASAQEALPDLSCMQAVLHAGPASMHPMDV